MFSGLNPILAEARILPQLTDLLPSGTEIHLVGGALRNSLLGLPVDDFDFATAIDPTDLARSFAGKVGGHWFFLDEERRQSRVVVRRGEVATTCDFAPYRGPDLVSDLRLRDFTINAMALPLSAGGEGASLLDPLRGREDLEKKLLRACSPGVLRDDPLRILKGVRHAVTLGFSFEEETARLNREAVPLLSRVAPERIRSELARIFSIKTVISAISLMESMNLAEVLFGPPGEGVLEPARVLLHRSEEILEALSAAGEPAASLLEEEVESGLPRRALLKLTAFLRGYAPARMATLSDVLRLGREAKGILSSLAEISAWREDDFRVPPGRPRALKAAELGRFPVEGLFFLPVLSGEQPEKAVAKILPFLEDFLRFSRAGRVPDLIDGRTLRTALELPEGPKVGEVLARLRREEIAGRVRTPEEAWQFLLGGKKSR